MSTIKTEITSVITLQLTDGEAGALDAICGYGPEVFLKWFKATHGSYYIERYENNLRSLFTKARMLNHQVKRIEQLRAAFPKNITV